MKYWQYEGQFVKCNQIDSKNIHESKLIDDCCFVCLELYEDFKDHVMMEFESENRDRFGVDMYEIDYNEESGMMKFIVEHKPII